MPQTGTLRSWNDDRGFGFIAPNDGGPEIFVHVRAFPRDGTHPTVGEKLTFEVGPGRDGKRQALSVVRLAVGRTRGRPVTASRRADKTSWVGTLMFFVLLGGLAAIGYKHFAQSQHRRTLASQPATATAESSTSPAQSAFRCDGRKHCSQMTSCVEAKWFINNCPGTQMDGNNDGIPCEQQWCTN